MSGIDTILAQFVEYEIRRNLGKTTIQKIENRLFEKYGMSISESMNQFEKFDAVLYEFFGSGARGLEEKVFKKLVTIKEYESIDEHVQIIIKNPDMASQIMSTIANKEKFDILTCVFEQPKISSEIIKECQMPQTSGYRKIKELFHTGFLIEKGHITTSDGKKAHKYNSVFGSAKISIHKNNVSIKIQIPKQHARTSKFLQRFEMPLVT